MNTACDPLLKPSPHQLNAECAQFILPPPSAPRICRDPSFMSPRMVMLKTVQPDLFAWGHHAGGPNESQTIHVSPNQSYFFWFVHEDVTLNEPWISLPGFCGASNQNQCLCRFASGWEIKNFHFAAVSDRFGYPRSSMILIKLKLIWWSPLPTGPLNLVWPSFRVTSPIGPCHENRTTFNRFVN